MPDGWSQVQLGEIIVLDIDRVRVEDDHVYPMAGVYSFARGLFRRDEITGADTAYPVLHRLHEGQLVLSRLFGWEGAIAPVTADFEGCFLSQEFPTFRPTAAVTLGYLTLVTQQPRLWDFLRQRAVGLGGRRFRVKPDAFLQSAVLLPSLEEQRRIVSLVARVDAYRAAAARVADATSAARRSLAVGLLERVERRERLADVVEVTMGRQRSPAHATGDDMTAYLRAANVKDGYLDLRDVKTMNFASEERARYALSPGDVLVTEGCGSLEQLGASAAYGGEIGSDVCFQNTLLRLRAKPGTTSPKFVEVLARWAFDTGLFASVAKGTNIYHLGAKRAGALQVPVPPLEEQERITALLAAADETATAARKIVRRAGTARQALVTQLLAGEHIIPASYDALLQEDGADGIEAA